MDKWSKIGDIWRLDIGDTLSEVALLRGELARPVPEGPVPAQHFIGLPPGHYYPPGGALLVPPRERIGRFLRIDIQNNEKQIDLFSGSPGLLRPEKRQKTLGRRSRPTRVTIELPEDLPIDYIFNPYDGSAIRISIGGSLVTPVKVIIENYYERAKADKIINKFVYGDDWAYHEANAVLRRYDRLYAIDTNTTRHKTDRLLSVSTILEATVKPMEPGVSMFEAAPLRAVCALDIAGKPEVEAWKSLIKGLLPMLDSGLVRRIGIVVDSELGLIESLNLRERPLVDNLYLPLGVELIYATDSAGTDQFSVNRMISVCDKLSTDIARRLRKVDVEKFSSFDAGALRNL